MSEPQQQRAVANDDDNRPSRVEVLFREHNEALLRFLRTRLPSDADAKEAAQEAYVRLLQLDRLDQPSFLRAYLFKIASNVATDVLRRRAVHRRCVHGDGPPEDAVGPTQEAAMAAREQLALVEKALGELPPKCRTAFLLRRREGLPAARVAEELGVSERMVRLYLERALEHIQFVLNADQRRSPRP